MTEYCYHCGEPCSGETLERVHVDHMSDVVPVCDDELTCLENLERNGGTPPLHRMQESTISERAPERPGMGGGRFAKTLGGRGIQGQSVDSLVSGQKPKQYKVPQKAKDVHVRWMIRRDLPGVVALMGGGKRTEEWLVKAQQRRDTIAMIAEKTPATMGEDYDVNGFMVYQLKKDYIRLVAFGTKPGEEATVGHSLLNRLMSKLSADRRNKIVIDGSDRASKEAYEYFGELGFIAKPIRDGGETRVVMTYPYGETTPKDRTPEDTSMESHDDDYLSKLIPEDVDESHLLTFNEDGTLADKQYHGTVYHDEGTDDHEDSNAFIGIEPEDEWYAGMSLPGQGAPDDLGPDPLGSTSAADLGDDQAGAVSAGELGPDYFAPQKPAKQGRMAELLAARKLAKSVENL